MTVAIDRTKTPSADPRGLIADELFDRLTAHIVHDHPEIDRPEAEQIVAETLAFLLACATASADRAGLVPTARTDIGWHAFILHTVDYIEFCDRVAGYYIQHVPTPRENTESGDCSQCYQGCTDSPSKARRAVVSWV